MKILTFFTFYILISDRTLRNMSTKEGISTALGNFIFDLIILFLILLKFGKNFECVYDGELI